MLSITICGYPEGRAIPPVNLAPLEVYHSDGTQHTQNPYSGYSIDVSFTNPDKVTKFNLGFRGVISGVGLSNYFNNITSKQPYERWLVLSIKGGHYSETSNTLCHVAQKANNIKFYSLDETDTENIDCYLNKKELRTDVWYIEDYNYCTLNATTDSFMKNWVVYRSVAPNVYIYVEDFTSEDISWTSNLSEAYVFRDSEQFSGYDKIPARDNIPTVNIAQPLSLKNTTGFAFSPKQNEGYNITALSGSSTAVYCGTATTPKEYFDGHGYESTDWVLGFDYRNCTYFRTLDDAKALTSEMTTYWDFPYSHSVGTSSIYSANYLNTEFQVNPFSALPDYKFIALEYVLSAIRDT